MIDQIAIDLTRTVFRRQSRGFLISGTWRFDQKPPEPCLVITLPYRAISFTGTEPCVIPLHTAFKWQDEHHAGQAVGSFLQALGETFSPRRAAALFLAVQDHLADLLAIPPYVGEVRVVGEVTRIDQHGKVHEDQIVERK